MSSLYSYFLRPLLFSLDPERAHRSIVGILKLTQAVPPLRVLIPRNVDYPLLEQSFFGKKFSSPIGLAAGFDKDCEIYPILSRFGFGFIECGTITAQAQPGNPKPRMFRLVEEQALINRLGFNNDGADRVLERLRSSPVSQIPLGINLGKTKVTPLEKSAEDYSYSFEKLFDYGDYFTINVSSPNTPGLRDLQYNLNPLLTEVMNKNKFLSEQKKCPAKNVFVKISPELSEEELDGVIQSALDHRCAGIIATNTTLSRDGIHQENPIEGGLSGKPLFKKSTDFIRRLYKKVGKKLLLIGVGGISTPEDAYTKIKAGASLVQVYTGWVYGGPTFVQSLNQGLSNLLKKDGLTNIKEAIGQES